MRKFQSILLPGSTLLLLLLLLGGLFISPPVKHAHRHGDSAHGHTHSHGQSHSHGHSHPHVHGHTHSHRHGHSHGHSSTTVSSIHEATSHYHLVLFGWTITLPDFEHQVTKTESLPATKSAAEAPTRLTSIDSDQEQIAGLPSLTVSMETWWSKLLKLDLFWQTLDCTLPDGLQTCWQESLSMPSGRERSAPPVPPPEACRV